MAKSMRRAALMMSVAMCTFSGTAAATNIIVIPTLDGSSNGACAINADGLVVGWSFDANGQVMGFAWDQQGPVHNIGSAGGSFSIANNVNNAGQIAGDSLSGSGTLTAVSWVEGIGLDVFSSSVSFGNDVNDFGLTVGAQSVADNLIATIWDSDKNPTHLGTLGGNSSIAFGVNNLGQVVGGAFDANGVRDPFLWTEGGGMVSLGNLGGDFSAATAINEQSQIVGFSTNSEGFREAFLWTSADGMIGLGTLGGDISRATDINNLGQVVGTSYDADGEQFAFLWTEESGMVNLMDFLKFDHGWDQLLVADGINDAGQIVGTGIYEGEIRGYVLTIPSPGALALLLIAGLFTRGSHRRRNRNALV